MIKGKWLELIRTNSLQNGMMSSDDAGKMSLRTIEVQTALVFADAIMMLIKKENDLDYFCKSYNDVAIDYDQTTKQYTSTLPCRIIQLPNNNGVRVIKGIGSNRIFIKGNYSGIDLFSDMDAAKYYDRTQFVMEGKDKIKYINFSYQQHNTRKVMMKLIPDFMEYAMTDDVPIPSGRLTELTNIVAKQLFQNNKFKDTSSDGV